MQCQVCFLMLLIFEIEPDHKTLEYSYLASTYAYLTINNQSVPQSQHEQSFS